MQVGLEDRELFDEVGKAVLPYIQAPQPSDHVLTVWKAGESVIQALLLTKTVVHVALYIEEHNRCLMHYFGVKTLSETFFFPPLIKPGYGARWLHATPCDPWPLEGLDRAVQRAAGALHFTDYENGRVREPLIVTQKCSNGFDFAICDEV